MSDTAELERYLREQIPLARALGVRVVTAGPELARLEAPLEPNINHHESVFGGSAASVALLAAWTLLHVRLKSAGLPAQLVVQRCNMEYLRPIRSAFTATATLTDPDSWEAFAALLTRRGRARITVTSRLEDPSNPAAVLTGEFVAMTQSSGSPRE